MRNRVLVALTIIVYIMLIADVTGTCIGLALSPKIIDGRTHTLVEKNPLVYAYPLPFFFMTIIKIAACPLLIYVLQKEPLHPLLHSLMLCACTVHIIRHAFYVALQVQYILL